MAQTLAEAKKTLAQYAALAWQRGLAYGSGGNISQRWQEGLLISRSGASLRALGEADILRVDKDCLALDAAAGCRPSIETAFHAAIYQARPEINAILHTHSTYATLFAVLGRRLPLPTLPARLLLGQVSLVPPAEPGSSRLCALISQTLAGAGEHCPALLLAGHGAVAMGPDLEAAYNTAELIEDTARTAWLLEQAGCQVKE